MRTKLPIDSIRVDGETQSRVEISQETVAEYAEVLQAGGKLPPLTVYFDGEAHWLVDGFHRLLAYQKANKRTVPIDQRSGTRLDAMWAAAGANLTHGLKRTNADKRKATEMALKLRPDFSDRLIAEHCGVHDNTVKLVRRQLEEASQIDRSDSRTRRDGRRFTVPLPTIPSPSCTSQIVRYDSDSEGQEEAPCTSQIVRYDEPDSGRVEEPVEATATPENVNEEPPSDSAGEHPQDAEDQLDAEAPIAPPGPKKGQLDEVGWPIPDHLLPFWERRSEIDGMLRVLSELRSAIRRAEETADPLFAAAGCSQLATGLSNCYDSLKHSKPYAVCPYCRGIIMDGCTACKGRGFITRLCWRAVPRELREATPPEVGQ